MKQASNSETTLTTLAQGINDNEASCRACEVKGLMHGLRIGQLLLDAKKIVPHGQFLDWVKKHTSVTPRMCQIYMKIARNDDLVSAAEREHETVLHLTLNAAVALVRKKTAKEWAKKISAKWSEAKEGRREWADDLAEVRQIFGPGSVGEGEFKQWLVRDVNLSVTLAEKILGLLNIDFDDEAWFSALIEDLVDKCEGGRH